MKKLTVTKAKTLADKYFSRFIRLRDSLLFGKYGWCKCCSCGKVDEIKNMDAGHWINRKANITRYDETNAHSQCQHCNRFQEGNASGYARFMLAEYGSEHMDDLDELHWQLKQFKAIELKEIADEYRLKVKTIEKEHGKVW